MGKLYSLAGGNTPATTPPVTTDNPEPSESLSEMLVEGISDLEDVSEAYQMAAESLGCAQVMYTHMGRQKLCTEAYVATMEGYGPLVSLLGPRMGFKSLPAMEDFANPYAAKTCHNYAMEGLGEMVARAFEKLKAFLRSFFKKITMFLKRIVRANLDLESYEKYCETLIRKLEQNKATISDNTATMVSELPKLLAGKGDAEVSPDYILNQGQQKVKNLLASVEDAIRQSGSGTLGAGLKAFNAKFKDFVASHSNAVSEEEQLLEGIADIKQRGLSLLSGLFPYSVNDIRTFPPKAYESILSYYDGRDINDDGFTVMSMCNPNDPYKELPQGINMYLTHVNNDKIFVCSGKDEVPQVPSTVRPISNLNNLSTYYREYKATLGRLNLSQLDKSAAVVANEVDSILSTLQKDFSTLMDGSRVTRRASSLAFVVHMLKKLYAAKGMSAGSILLANLGTRVEESDSNYEGYSEVCQFASIAYSESERSNAESAFRHHTAEFQARGTIQSKHIDLFVDFLLEGNESIFGSTLNEEEAKRRYDALQNLNQFLVGLFSRIQSIYKSLMTDFFSTLTSIRYAVIKYIYDSAKRYSY